MDKITIGILIIIAFGLGMFTQKKRNVEYVKTFQHLLTKKNIKINNLRGLNTRHYQRYNQCVTEHDLLVVEANKQIQELKDEITSLSEKLENAESSYYKDEEEVSDEN